MKDFETLIQEAEQAHFSGWDFSWLRERWIESEPDWDYGALVLERIPAAQALLDMGTGGGEFLASLPSRPAQTCATEAYPPNLPVARARLEPLGIPVSHVDEVLERALVTMPEPISWTEEDDLASQPGHAAAAAGTPATAH